ncbi:1,4-alpha-glucan branching protein GlgB [Christensenellaceae bacterium NSJ-63]|uniref:1,4-alpha-glucan branching enzyme GlgB n=1 Tax=Guopingia tenuis TaxID=2763656 RepID=A0A926HW04_9FIRM|nr:1,4-alpha-glucan branching protein GlgB [Guopingia tenuis]
MTELTKAKGLPYKDDIYLFNIGEAQRAYLTFGCHYMEEIGMHRFCVWAPNARNVSIVGDFNGWDSQANPMEENNGVWTGFVGGLRDGDNYKYCIFGYDGNTVLKSDPFAFHAEVRPNTASKVWNIEGYEWKDAAYMRRRAKKDVFTAPMSIYELHLGSWRKPEGYQFASLREMTDEVVEYVKDMGYTHVELLPVYEHPLDGSWGYQVTGYYAFTSRYGTPQDFMHFVDRMHEEGIGVILDWVPAHFPKDAHGLARFDGTCLYEHENPLLGEHPQWGTLIFNYGRPEVQSFLVSNAVYWMDKYHVDGFRMDAVSSMLYLDFGRENGNYVRNAFGGNYNLEAIDFLRKVNSTVLTLFPGTVMVAEESSAFPMVTKPPYDDGLGFTFKWNMGFMNDTLRYFEMDPIYRKDHHNLITFAMMYAFSENFILPYSHDEVVHGKKSMLDKMPGDYWQKFATLRALYGFQFAHPGKKLMFMGDEFGQFIEWNENQPLDWFLLEYESHAQMKEYVRKLNRYYKRNRALYEIEDSWEGFTWLDVQNNLESTVSFMRSSRRRDGKVRRIVCVCNFTPVVRYDYPIGMPLLGTLKEVLNSDDTAFGGSGVLNAPKIQVEDCPGPESLPYSARVTLPPLATVYFEFMEAKPPAGKEKKKKTKKK